MAILGVTERGHVPREGHAGTDVPPQGACREGSSINYPALITATQGGEAGALIKIIKK